VDLWRFHGIGLGTTGFPRVSLSVMGWGTFIAGRILSKRRPDPTLLEGLSGAVNNYVEIKTDFEIDVLNEMKRMQFQGLAVDPEIARTNVRQMNRARKTLGPRLKMQVVKEAQKKILANENVNYQEIERDILLAWKPVPVGLILQWILIPYVPLTLILYKKYLRNNEPENNSK